jgi:hypothetical protein
MAHGPDGRRRLLLLISQRTCWRIGKAPALLH